ncbi:MAG TPA: BREX system P-loop protein BrxC [Pyrinomonadaceae bacterium]|nr:BREX system P-loop protein BrxC [Pyrinomonadaceae bacterium]
MQIKNIFHKDIFRPINGVIKVNDTAESSIWQELDEYVLTAELKKHFSKFFGTYLEAVDNRQNSDIRNKIGVWVSGFFGSGKSHFIKIISHLLQNNLVTNPATGETKYPIDFFEKKITDQLFFNEIKRAVETPADVLLFNIDSKAEDASGRDAILRVFMRVLNELQDYCVEYPYLADVERQLESDGKYESFKNAFAAITDSTWQEERDIYGLRRDETIQALSESTGMSAEAAQKLIDDAEKNYNLSVEKFARRVKEYLDRKSKDHRIIFVADEVGQFIGTDTHLMLNLQTIVENLGTICEGKAWVVVTSQEDMDSVLGNVVGAKSNDFSKIQGRFPTRLSLSSSNTDEVIQARLLEKTKEAEANLDNLFKEKGDVLKNQLSFSGGATLKNFKTSEDFTRNYPFAPYHYQIVQSVFESIRKAGATGLHLARGERSMLDAFQMGAKSIAGENIGKLVPFYSFYPSVESFLDTSVAKTINQAAENEGLEDFDTEVLRVLFLIRYVDIIKPNVENLVTLCIEQVDDDRLALKKQIEESLTRLEKQTLISRNGDLFYFLTNEERDIGREIKSVDVSADETFRQLSEFLFNEILSDTPKFRYPVNKKDFSFNRLADGRAFQGVNSEQNLNLELITPLNDEFDLFTEQRCILSSDGRILIRLGDNKLLSGELREFLQTRRYIQQKSDSSAPETTRRILQDKAIVNQQRSQRINEILKKLLDEGDIYAAGQKLSAERKITISEAQNYLVTNLFTKLKYLNAPANDPFEDIKSVLLADDVGQQTLNLDAGQPNAHALDEIRSYINLRANNNLRITLEEITQQFEKQPFGWRDADTALLVSKLFAAGEIAVKIEAVPVEPRAAIDSFSKPGRWKFVQIVKRQTTGAAELSKARALAHEVFGKLSPETKEDELAKFIRKLVEEWQINLRDWRTRAESGEFPGFSRIKDSLELANELNNNHNSFEFFRQFNEKREDWIEASEDYHKLHDFYKNQIEIWKRLRSRLHGSYKDNRSQLDFYPDANAAILRMEEILRASEPYGMIREIDSLIATVDQTNDQILRQRREQAVQSVETRITQLKSELDSINADSDTRYLILSTFQQLKPLIEQENSIPKISYFEGERAEELFLDALEAIENKRPKIAPVGGGTETSRPTRTIKPAQFAVKPYIESAEDAEDYLNRVRAEIDKYLAENAKIRIQ